MMKFPAICFLVLSVGACGGTDTALAPNETLPLVPLRQLATARGRYVGGVTGTSFTTPGGNGPMLRSTLSREFSMVWSGNFLKFSWLRPTRTTYDFTWADSMVAFAAANNMVVRGHTLVWHNQLSTWVTSGGFTPFQADSILRDHINTVMGRYRSKVGIWDVVNEAVEENGSLRTASYWHAQLGSSYIERSFRLAAEADPSARLFYNDYNIEGVNAKSDGVYALIKDLKARGVPIHGIGFQAHFEVGKLPSRESMTTNFARFAALGLVLQVTELDVRMPVPASAANLTTQANDFRTVFAVCLDTPACNAVELSNTFDGESWIPGAFPGMGSAGILDETFKPKPAYLSVNSILAGR